MILKGTSQDAMGNMILAPLYLAALDGHAAAALALLAGGANFSIRRGQYGTGVVHVGSQNRWVDILRAAMNHGMDAGIADTRHRTVLHRAGMRNRKEAIDSLVEAGAKIEAQGSRSLVVVGGVVFALKAIPISPSTTPYRPY